MGFINAGDGLYYGSTAFLCDECWQTSVAFAEQGQPPKPPEQCRCRETVKERAE
jgi:hypothetical protein